MLKKFPLLLLALILSGCASSNKPALTSQDNSDVFDFGEVWLTPQQEENTFRVGMLLPLSGKASKQGQGLKNAALMAMDDVKNPQLILQFYDTQSTPEGARTAVENALSQKVKLIVGPLSSNEVKAISEETVYNQVPVIAFSTSKDVLQPTVYTLGLLIDEQVNRIMSYASSQGRSKFALLLPDNATGVAVARAALASAALNNVEVTKIAFYPPNTTNFAEIVKQLTDYGTRSALLNRKKANLTALANQGDITAQRQLKQLKTTNSMGDPGFDAVLIPEYGLAGVGIATLGANFLYFLLSIIIVLPGLRLICPFSVLNKMLISAVPFAGLYFVFCRVMHLPALFEMLLLMSIFYLCYWMLSRKTVN